MKTKQCDNTDHKGEATDIKEVEMAEEFLGGVVYWCADCRERDKSFIKTK